VNPAFWVGRRVFVTGHTGFKGAWLCVWLKELGADVTGYSLAPSTEPNLFEVAEAGRKMRSLIGDIRDLESLRDVLRFARPEIVIHMAAQALVRLSYSEPVETYGTNVMGTVHILEAVRTVPEVRAVVVVTSDKCYENRESVRGYRETDPMGGHDPYSNSKGCAELVTAAYRSSYFADPERRVGISSARAGNVIGGGDWAKDRLIPDVVGAFAAGRPAIVRNPGSVRPWQHVLEPLAGYLTLAERVYDQPEAFAEGWNFGPSEDDARPVSWLVTQLGQLWGEDCRWESPEGRHPHEANSLKLDCSKARARLGWTPKLELSTALDWVVEWYRCFHSGGDVSGLTLDQISRYQARAPA